MLSQGLGGFRAQPVTPETGTGERLPSRTTEEFDARQTLRLVRDDLDDAIDDLGEPDGKPDFLRGDFGANLLDETQVSRPVPEALRMKIASALLRGIEADILSRKQWEEMANRAIQFLGLIYEEASSDVSSEGSISKAWATLMLEAALGFWANAYAEFLTADGPVKVRDDKPAAAGMGNTGAPVSLRMGDDSDDAQDQTTDRAALAEAFEHDYNHYLLVGDKQYVRDFSRMLWSLGPIGTEFRKIYYNPLRKLPVSEWVKSSNLIVSNEAADLSTANRITERIPNFLQADVKRLQWMGWWLDVPLGVPISEPTSHEKKIAETEGIRLGADLPEDYPHTFYECHAPRDLEGFEHTEDGRQTGLPLPYRFTIDKDSRQLLAIRRDWKENDEDFRRRQHYVMFGMVPGFGLYYLGFSHLLGNTERAATAITREMIDVGMVSIFPGWLAEKGALPKGATQIRVGPMGVQEVTTAMGKKVSDSLEPIPIRPLDPQMLALLQKLEQNGRNVSGKLELPQGEGTQNIPVGTMIAIVEQGTKVMMAVHKGLHASRAEELELLRELIAEDPSVLTKYAKSPKRKEWIAEEFQDLDLVPSSDPNTPSHVHRLMRGIGLAQIKQMFPEVMTPRISRNIYDALLRILQVQQIDQFSPNAEEISQQANQPPQPNPQQIAAEAKMGVAQLQAQMKTRDSQLQEQSAAADRASKEKVALIDQQTEQLKTSGQIQSGILKQHDSAAEQARDHAHETAMQQRDHIHEATQNQQDRTHEQYTASLGQPTPRRPL